MDILNRISELLGEREQKELTSYLGIKSSAFSEWKSGKTQSYKKYLIEISEFFGVSIDYLVYGKEVASQLSDAESGLIKKFKILNDIDQKRVLKQIDTFLQDYPDEEVKTEVSRKGA